MDIFNKLFEYFAFENKHRGAFIIIFVLYIQLCFIIMKTSGNVDWYWGTVFLPIIISTLLFITWVVSTFSFAILEGSKCVTNPTIKFEVLYLIGHILVIVGIPVLMILLKQGGIIK